MLRSDVKHDRPQESWLDRPLLAAVNLDREKALYALLIILAVLSRLWNLDVRVMSHDETVHVQWSWYLFRGSGYQHTPLSHGPFLYHATALSYYLFGDTDFSARLAVAIMGIALVALPYTLRRWLGRAGALVASFLFLISPSLLYYSRYIRHDIPVIVWTLIAVLAMFRYLEEGQHPEPRPEPVEGQRPEPVEGQRPEPVEGQRPEPVEGQRPEPAEGQRPEPAEGRARWLMVLAAFLSLMFATKEVSFIYVGIFGLFLVLLFLTQLGAPRWRAPSWEQTGRALLWVAAGTLLLATLTLGLSGIVDTGTAETTESAMSSPDEAVEPPTSAETTNRAADVLRQIAKWSARGTLAALLAYVGLLALGSTSHQRLIWTILGIASVALLAVGLLLFSLNLVELFPIRQYDCGQAPVPGALPGEMHCPEGDCKLIQGRCQRPIPVIANDNVAEYDETGTRIAIRLTRLEILVTVMLLGTVALMAGVGVYFVLERLMPFGRLRTSPFGRLTDPAGSTGRTLPFRHGAWPTLDLIFFIGSFALPFASPVAIHGLSRIASRLFAGANVAFNSLDYSEAGLMRSVGFVLILLAVGVAAGLWWDWRRWLPAAAVFYAIFVVLFTTIFTNGNGLASGMVGSVGYWLEQQGVERGSQPFYYYGITVPLYEYLPIIGFVAAALYVLVRGLRPRNAQFPAGPLFVPFLLFWTVATWLAYSAAGEKMPWLTTHFAVPMGLATAWIVGKLIEGSEPAGVYTHWRAILRRGGWLLLLIAPVGLAALVQVISPWLARSGTPRPFSGHSLGQLNVTLEFIAALLVLAVSLAALFWVWQRVGAAAIGRSIAVLAVGVLAVLTIRTAWTFAYVNYDYASEFLVYAHSTPDVREVMEQIEDISRRTAGDLSLDIAYTADGSYPFIWYLRNYPNAAQVSKPPSREQLDKPVIIAGDAEWPDIEPYLGDHYACNQYNFLWWPMEDYRTLTWERIRYAITNPEMRAAVWDIIFRRDYRRYEQAIAKIEAYPRKVRLSEWPLRDGFRFCIRRDLASRVWSESAGPAVFVPEVTELGPELPDYAGLELPVAAELVVGELDPFGNWSGPHGMALDADGLLYVADSDNHRIVKLSPEGQVLDTWDSTWWHGLQSWQPGCLDEADRPLALEDGQFCEPWGVTVGPDGKVYVADTWNHRVQVFSRDGQFLAKVGTFGQSGSSVSSAKAQFYGPRDVVVDERGHIYVSDTGNKRVQVLDADLNHLDSFGGPGITKGRMDEPVGLAIGLDNLLYVADTWNRRIQVLTLEGNNERQWPIAGWESQSTLNKPFVATDSAGHVYVSDPENARVIVFDDAGTPLAVLGGLGSGIFQLPTGVILDAQDRLWVSDAGTQRLLRFPPLSFGDEGQTTNDQ
jgi:uncharacterized protein (TIGR03663 family)